MLKFTINGKSVRPGEIKKELMRVTAACVAKQVRERLGAIRHPETGEFPTVVVEGDSLDDMALRVEGSAALLELVKARLSPEDLQLMTLAVTDVASPPRVFLSYGWEDRELARKIAEGLLANGIEVWWAEWEIGAGDSIRRKIDAGLGNCTHFIVLLTPASITRPWVNEEIDAAYMRKINAGCRFIPLRHGLAPDALPPLMSGMLSPQIDAVASDLQQLVNDIHGLSRKPSLGPAPTGVVPPRTGYSAAATAVAGLFVGSSRNGEMGDPQFDMDEIAEQTGLSGDDVTDALYELRNRVMVTMHRVMPKPTLFAEFDGNWQPWNPSKDALKIAADLVNDHGFPGLPAKIAERYGWTARRLNPAIAYLRERDAVRGLEALASGPFIVMKIDKTDATRRFVKSRS